MNLKKVLIITYYWPPAGGPGVQRWLKFVKYLPDFGIQPVVFVPENPNYPIIDKNLIDEVGKDTVIIKKKIFEPYQIASFFSGNKTQKISSGIIPDAKKQSWILKTLLWIRGNLFIPDARFLWVSPSVRFLKKYLQENQITTIITSGPPHSLHLIGMKLQKDLNLKWIADFRDPWTTIGYQRELKLSKFAQNKHKNFEKLVLNNADEIIVTSKSTKTEFQQITSQPITVITNGHDFEKIEIQNIDSKFSLAHIGSFLSNRNPQILWQCLSELILEVENFKTDLQIKLIGTVSEVILQTLADFDLISNTSNLGYLSHQAAMIQQRNSQVLLLLEIDSEDTKSIIPGKLFEYLISNRPILALGPQGSDFAEILSDTNTGFFFEYHQKQELKSKILEFYNLYLQNKLIVNAKDIDKYWRKNLTRKLVDLL